MNNNIRRIPMAEKQLVIDFLNRHWGSQHPLVNNKTLFDYYYADGDMTNFYVLEDDGEVAAVCGYIKCSEKSDSDIWISIWCAKKGKNGLGLTLMGAMKELTGAKNMSCNNIRENTMPFYTFLGYHPDKMNHFYRISDKNEYKMAVVNNKLIPESAIIDGTELVLMEDISQVKEHFSIPDGMKPQKDYWYINKRYFEYPHYKYKVYVLYSNKKPVSLVVFRVNDSDEGHVLRLVDYIGTKENFYLLSGWVDKLMAEFDCEFSDMYCWGVDGAKAGFVLRDENDTNIIPNYLNTLWQKNIDYFFFTSDPDGFMMFKADGDQDRKNLG
ncbi:MAG: hypothetical protein IKU54_04385 [Oscillospiraceae bacterium]|nr:hypothetical protein [Oscillospiraceae bacterium]